LFTNDPKGKARIQIKVTGRVQGVCFRYYTQQKAISLGLKGYVKNLPNGSSVEIVAEGTEDMLNMLLDWSKKGPPAANVLDITYSKENFLNEFSSFEITV
jgi:acylphosphatase